MKTRSFILLLAALACAVCLCALVGGIMALNSASSLAGGDLRYIVDLQQAIRQRFSIQDVRIGITNGNILKISVVNSAMNSLPPLEKNAKAQEIAVFTGHSFGGIKNMIQIDIAFIEETQNFIFLTTRSTTYSFPLSSLQP